MPVLIILTAKAMIEMMRKGEYRRLATRVLLVGVVVGMCCLLVRGIPATFSATSTPISSEEATLKLRFRSVHQAPVRIPFMGVTEHLSFRPRTSGGPSDLTTDSGVHNAKEEDLSMESEDSAGFVR